MATEHSLWDLRCRVELIRKPMRLDVTAWSLDHAVAIFIFCSRAPLTKTFQVREWPGDDYSLQLI